MRHPGLDEYIPSSSELQTVLNEMCSLRLHGINGVSERNALRVMRDQDGLATLGSDDTGLPLYSRKESRSATGMIKSDGAKGRIDTFAQCSTGTFWISSILLNTYFVPPT